MLLICFLCEEVSHIVAKCPNKEDKDDRKFKKYKGKKGFKSYKSCKDKGKKSWYIAKDSDSDEDEDEMVYIVVKDELDNENNKKMTLISHVRKNDTWIIREHSTPTSSMELLDFKNTQLPQKLCYTYPQRDLVRKHMRTSFETIYSKNYGNRVWNDIFLVMTN